MLSGILTRRRFPGPVLVLTVWRADTSQRRFGPLNSENAGTRSRLQRWAVRTRDLLGRTPHDSSGLRKAHTPSGYWGNCQLTDNPLPGARGLGHARQAVADLA